MLALDSQDRILRGFTARGRRLAVAGRGRKMSDSLYLTMLRAYEDQRFGAHPGVDPLAVARALGQWLRHGRVVSGASTLTMQAARLLEPHERDLAGKLGEMLRALQLERRYAKDEILQFLPDAGALRRQSGRECAPRHWPGSARNRPG
ncbi:MAG: transglycosylase domain-containing protein [Chromatiales bacterium]|nr:transglycosylase domain-containing protein [Chromatiales bacterium]